MHRIRENIVRLAVGAIDREQPFLETTALCWQVKKLFFRVRSRLGQFPATTENLNIPSRWLSFDDVQLLTA